MTDDLLALKPGTRLAHYVIERVLGQGGFGIVYKAHHDHLNDPVVVKEFLPSELAGRSSSTVVAHSGSKQGLYDDCLHRFMREGQVLVKLRHPNVVRCRDLFTENGTAYLVMDYEDGLPLDELVASLETQGKRYSEAQLMHFLMPLIDGLAYVHAQGILHRDIKPANVFIRRGDGSPVLLDFGAAKQKFLKASQSRSPYTEFYAPLEQIAGDGEAHATMDIHAFGGLMYRLVTGTVGPRAETRAIKLSSGQADPLVPASQLAADHYSADLLATIDACLSFRAEERPQTMEELGSRLARHQPQQSPPGPESTGFELLKDLLELAGADGVISDQEMSMLMAKARTLGIDASAAQAHIVSHAHRRGWQFKTDSAQKAQADRADETGRQSSAGSAGGKHQESASSGDLTYPMQLTLEEIMGGVVRQIEITRADLCEDCDGTGRSGTAGSACRACNASGRRPRKVALQIKVPAGVDTNDRIRLKGEGEPSTPGGSPGDLYVQIESLPHRVFTRDGLHLHANVQPEEHLKPGEKFRFETLDGTVSVKIPDQFQYPGVIRIAGRGLPKLQAKERGDLFLNVQRPDEASEPAPDVEKRENPEADGAASFEHRMGELHSVAVRSVVVLSLMTGLLIAGLDRKFEVVLMELAREINAPAIVLAAAASALFGLIWTAIAANIAYRKDAAELESALAASKPLQSAYTKALGKTWLIAVLILFLFTLIPLRGLFIQL